MTPKVGDDFDRDLGYLDAFFDKLEARGASMGGAAGDRLRVLVGEERRRWVEIRTLLSGAPARAAGAAVARPNSDPAPAQATPTTLTVGSLRGSRATGGTQATNRRRGSST